MNTQRILTETEKALFADIGEVDLPPRLPQPWRIISPNSHCLLRAHKSFHSDAKPERFIGPVSDSRMVLQTLRGILVGVENPWIERTSDFAFVAEHERKPPEAGWKNAADALDGKAGFRMSNGNPVFEHILAFWLLLNAELSRPTPGLFAFVKTGVDAGRELMNRASRFRDDALGIRGYVLGMWEIGTVYEQRNPKYPPYLTPIVRLLGRYGEAGGPTFDEMMLAAQVRKAFLAGEPWPPEISGAPAKALPASTEKPALPASASSASAPSSAPRAKMTVTSGRQTKWDNQPPVPASEDPGPSDDDRTDDAIDDAIPF